MAGFAQARLHSRRGIRQVYPMGCFPGGTRTCLPMQGMWVRFLSWEDPLEKEMATHSSIFAWRIPLTAWQVQSLGLQRVAHRLKRFSVHAHTQQGLVELQAPHSRGACTHPGPPADTHFLAVVTPACHPGLLAAPIPPLTHTSSPERTRPPDHSSAFLSLCL